LPLTSQATMQAKETEKYTKTLLKFCTLPRARGEIQNFLGLKNRDYFRVEILNPLVAEGLLLCTLPDKPTSPKQKYYAA
jgi:ATP-dependent DNA helicase RecG